MDELNDAAATSGRLGISNSHFKFKIGVFSTMFIVSLTYVCEMSEVDRYLDSHIAYLNNQYAKGIFLASGRKEPRTGGIILAVANSRELLDTILAQDPFNIHGLATYEVTEFIPTKASEELSFLLA
jgi:uncharacterized protein YciI